MGKIENLRIEFDPIFQKYLATADNSAVIRFLCSHSDLPGRRANLELASVFVMLCESFLETHSDAVLDLLSTMLGYDSKTAPTNNPEEILAFCATKAMGIPEVYYHFGPDRLGNQASDDRWRIREAVAMALSRLIESTNDKMQDLFDIWLLTPDWLLRRAIIAGYAHPKLLRRKNHIEQAFAYHQQILTEVQGQKERSDDFDILIKALKYTISVIVAADPETGFVFMQEWIEKGDNDINSVMKENLRKNRIKKQYPEEVGTLSQLL